MNAVGVAFGAENVVLVVDKDAMGILQDAFAPDVQKVAIPVEDNQWMFAARVDIDVVFGIASHARNPAKRPTAGQLSPAFDKFIAIVTCTEFHE